MALSVTGERPNSRKATVTALVAPLVLAEALADVNDPINDYALSGKEAGSTVYAVTAGTLKEPTAIEVRISTGAMPSDPWVSPDYPVESDVSVDEISDAGTTGKSLMKAESSSDAKSLLGYLTTSDVATSTVRGPVRMAGRQVGINLSSSQATASTATTLEDLVSDHNTLVSSYNSLQLDLSNVNSSLTSTIVALKAAGHMVS